MLTWLKENKDAVATIIAILSIVITAVVWTFNHQYNQYIRIGILEQNVLTLQRSFSQYHRTLLVTELVKVEQELSSLQSQSELSSVDRTKLVDLLVKQQVLVREIAEIGSSQ